MYILSIFVKVHEEINKMGRKQQIKIISGKKS